MTAKLTLLAVPLAGLVLAGSMLFAASKPLSKEKKPSPDEATKQAGEVHQQVCKEGVCGSVSASANRQGPSGCTQGKLCTSQGTCAGTCTTVDDGTTCACSCM